MKTKKITVKSNGEGREEAVNEAEKFAAAIGLSGKYMLRFRLLAEEALGMLQGIVVDFAADFFAEEKDGSYYITIEASTNMDRKKRKKLISVSSSGKNTAAKGIMGKIRELFLSAVDEYEEINALASEYGGGYMNWGYMGVMNASDVSASGYYWSLNQYCENLSSSEERQITESLTGEAVEEAYDELEKSIVANLADDIKVGILKDKVNVVLETSADTIRMTKKHCNCSAGQM